MAGNVSDAALSESKDSAPGHTTTESPPTDSEKPAETPEPGAQAHEGELAVEDKPYEEPANHRPESPPYETPVGSPPLPHDDAPKINLLSPKVPSSDDPDAQAMVIESLRSQILDLSTQVTQLNGKLIRSYDRVSDLEDELHTSTAKLDSSTSLITALQAERSQHMSALDTGLLVEKEQVTAELTRLMEKATEEAAHRGQAESKRTEIEKELDDLSANLFEQANGMVRQARGEQAISNRKAQEAESALRQTEEVVRVMQQRMQELQAEKDAAEKLSNSMAAKGKWVNLSTGQTDLSKPIRLLSSHSPYTEFLMFVAHLRSIRPATPTPPNITSLLPLPFLTRLLTEDSEPTVRLDLAPSLNWLSRRSVLAAIHSGQLTIEPMPTHLLLNEGPPSHPNSPSAAKSPSLSSAASSIQCALCGVYLFASEAQEQSRHGRPSTHTSSNYSGGHAQNNSSWSTSLFKRPLSINSTDSPPPPPSRTPRLNGINHKRAGNSVSSSRSKQVYIFRLATQASSFQSIQLQISLPLSRPQHSPSMSGSGPTTPSGSRNTTPAHTPSLIPSPNQSSAGVYPLCTNGWCLARLRTTCTLWAFVRSGIIDRVWDEELPSIPSSPTKATSGSMINGIEDDKLPGSLQRDSQKSRSSDKPPIPPRRRGLWGMASALGERATASWAGKDKPPSDNLQDQDLEKWLPPPPPSHPQNPRAERNGSPTPPPLPRRSHSRPPRDGEAARTGSETTSRAATPSQEAVTTASDGALPAISNSSDKPPLSPRLVSLPESRAGTPTPAVKRQLNPQVPSRSGSPAPGGAPPPLPRRAPARSRAAGGDGGPAGSRPGTPAPAASAQPAQGTDPSAPSSDVPGPQDSAPGEAAAKAAPASDTPAPEADSNADIDSAPAVAPATTPAPAEGKDDDSPAPVPAADKGAVDPKPADEADAASEPPAYSKADDKPAAEVLANGHIDDDVSEPARDTKSEDHSEESAAAKETDESGASYVGDATWEERTWREIVRLREDMFWARVGAFR